MILEDEFKRTGEWLFRWRSYLPLLFIAFLFLAFREYQYPAGSEAYAHLWTVACLFISFFGLLIRMFTVGFVPKGTSGRNTKGQLADELNTTGLYSMVRNPLYLGNFFIGLGMALFVHIWWFTLIYVLLFWIYYERIIFAEEAYLRKKFGRVYLEWADKTPAFIPNIQMYRKPAVPFSLRKVLRREYDSFFGIIAVFFILENAGELAAESRIDFEVPWTILFSLGLLTWFVLRFLRKRTNLLAERP